MHQVNDALFYMRGSIVNALIVAYEYTRMRHAIEIREDGQMTLFWICRDPSELFTIINDEDNVDRCIRCLSNERLYVLTLQFSGSKSDIAWRIVREAVARGFTMETRLLGDTNRTTQVFLRRKHRAHLPVNFTTDQLQRMQLDDTNDDMAL